MNKTLLRKLQIIQDNLDKSTFAEWVAYLRRGTGLTQRQAYVYIETIEESNAKRGVK